MVGEASRLGKGDLIGGAIRRVGNTSLTVCLRS
jgi:hypothetical protein